MIYVANLYWTHNVSQIQAKEELLEARKQVQNANERSALAEQAAGEHDELQEQLQEAESRHSAALSAAQMQAQEAQGILDSVSRERDQLLQEVELPRQNGALWPRLKSNCLSCHARGAARKGLATHFHGGCCPMRRRLIVKGGASPSSRTPAFICRLLC